MKYTLFIIAMLLNFQVFAQQKPKLELFIKAYVAKNMNDDVYLNAKKGVAK